MGSKKGEEATIEQSVVKKESTVYTGFLKNETITVQFIPKPTREISNPNHVAYGGKLEGTYDYISPPRLDKGKMQNILTKEEKEGLEFLMGRDLSIYGDFWKGYRKGGLFPVALGKEDKFLNLSVPEDYIVYKVLLNTNLVANSTQQMKDEPRESYKWVMVKEDETDKIGEERVNEKAEAYAFYNQHSSNSDVLRYILRKLGKHTHGGQKLSFLREQVGLAIDNPKYRSIILKLSKDKALTEKVLLEQAFTLGIIDRVSNQYFTKEGEPISGEGEDPTEFNSARFLGLPVGQEMRLAIEARIKNAKE